MKIEMSKEKILNFISHSNITLEEIEAAAAYLDELEKDSIKLSYLKAYGIDNTIAYEEAMYAYYNNIDEEDE